MSAQSDAITLIYKMLLISTAASSHAWLDEIAAALDYVYAE